jgi:hypothetical protein
VSPPAPPGRIPEPGSIADLVSLYSPANVRAALAELLALEAEIRTSARPDLDHTIAHVRLEWWQAEAERTLAGAPAHPLTRALRSLLDPQPLDIRPLVHSARLEVASLAGADEALWQSFFEGSLGTIFSVLGQVLGCTASPATLRTLGGAVQQLSTERAEPPALLSAALRALQPAQQRAMRPLLVWAALVGWRSSRGLQVPDESPPVGLRLAMAQQWVAWRAARAAEAGLFRWRWPRPAAAAPSDNTT